MSDIENPDAELMETDVSAQMEEFLAFRAWVEEAFAMAPADFLALTTKQQNSTIFVMLREMGAQMRGINAVVTKWDAQIAAATSPEGIAAFKATIMEEIGNLGGGMFKGLF